MLHLNFLGNTLLSLDLYLTVVNPFQPRAHRMKFYYLVLVAGFIFWTFYLVFVMQVQTYHRDFKKTPKFGLVLAISYITLALLAQVVVLIRLCKKGTSRTLRIDVFSRNLAYLIVYSLSVLKSLDAMYLEYFMHKELSLY
jgi:hypothetical protein